MIGFTQTNKSSAGMWRIGFENFWIQIIDQNKSEKRTEQSDLPTQEARSFVIGVCWWGSSVGRGPCVSRSKGHKIFE